MKNIKILILSLFICISFSLPVFATSSKPLVIDSANIISSNTEASLIKKAKEIQKKYNIDVVIATIPSNEGVSIEYYAETIYSQGGYGQGSLKDGMLLLLSMEDRDYDFYKKGKVNDNMTISVENSILDPTLSKLKNNDFDGAFNTFLNKVDEVYSKVKPDGSFSKEPKGHVPYLIGILGSFFIAFIIVQTGAATLKSVRFSGNADRYVKTNSVVISQGFEQFLHRNVTRRSKPKSNSSDSYNRSSGSSPHSSHTSGKF